MCGMYVELIQIIVRCEDNEPSTEQNGEKNTLHTYQLLKLYV